MTLYGLMILFFSYFWVATQFNELQIADDLKKNGGYIPGRAPGPGDERLSAQRHEPDHAGGRGLPDHHRLDPDLAALGTCRFPYAVATFFGGTSMLILVGVMLDTMRQMETHLLMRHYDGFLKKGRLGGGRFEALHDHSQERAGPGSDAAGLRGGRHGAGTMSRRLFSPG